MGGAVPLLRQYVFMAWCFVKHGCVFMAWNLFKHRDNFTFTFKQRVSFKYNCFPGKLFRQEAFPILFNISRERWAWVEVRGIPVGW